MSSGRNSFAAFDSTPSPWESVPLALVDRELGRRQSNHFVVACVKGVSADLRVGCVRSRDYIDRVPLRLGRHGRTAHQEVGAETADAGGWHRESKTTREKPGSAGPKDIDETAVGGWSQRDQALPCAMFHYALPVDAAPAFDDRKAAAQRQRQEAADSHPGHSRKPGHDLGDDPQKIPGEDIPDEPLFPRAAASRRSTAGSICRAKAKPND